jgi:hypothetical protein
MRALHTLATATSPDVIAADGDRVRLSQEGLPADASQALAQFNDALTQITSFTRDHPGQPIPQTLLNDLHRASTQLESRLRPETTPSPTADAADPVRQEFQQMLQNGRVDELINAIANLPAENRGPALTQLAEAIRAEASSAAGALVAPATYSRLTRALGHGPSAAERAPVLMALAQGLRERLAEHWEPGRTTPPARMQAVVGEVLGALREVALDGSASLEARQQALEPLLQLRQDVSSFSNPRLPGWGLQNTIDDATRALVERLTTPGTEGDPAVLSTLLSQSDDALVQMAVDTLTTRAQACATPDDFARLTPYLTSAYQAQPSQFHTPMRDFATRYLQADPAAARVALRPILDRLPSEVSGQIRDGFRQRLLATDDPAALCALHQELGNAHELPEDTRRALQAEIVGKLSQEIERLSTSPPPRTPEHLPPLLLLAQQGPEPAVRDAAARGAVRVLEDLTHQAENHHLQLPEADCPQETKQRTSSKRKMATSTSLLRTVR